MAVVVLPTPPFWLEMQMTRPTGRPPARSVRLDAGVAWWDDRATSGLSGRSLQSKGRCSTWNARLERTPSPRDDGTFAPRLRPLLRPSARCQTPRFLELAQPRRRPRAPRGPGLAHQPVGLDCVGSAQTPRGRSSLYPGLGNQAGALEGSAKKVSNTSVTSVRLAQPPRRSSFGRSTWNAAPTGGPSDAQLAMAGTFPRAKGRECSAPNRVAGISIEVVAEESPPRGARVSHDRSRQVVNRLPPLAASCSASLRAPQAVLWETWGKHRASGFPELLPGAWRQRVSLCLWRNRRFLECCWRGAARSGSL